MHAFVRWTDADVLHVKVGTYHLKNQSTMDIKGFETQAFTRDNTMLNALIFPYSP